MPSYPSKVSGGVRTRSPTTVRRHAAASFRYAFLLPTATLIGDKSGAAIIERTCGAIRSEHLMNQVRRVRLLLKPDLAQSQPDAASAT
jgi:hypothetical protein